MAGIAEDELAHAQLAWEVDAWARSRLSPAGAERVDSARRAAFDQLNEELDTRVPDLLLTQVGLPDPASIRHLLIGARTYLEV